MEGVARCPTCGARREAADAACRICGQAFSDGPTAGAPGGIDAEKAAGAEGAGAAISATAPPVVPWLAQSPGATVRPTSAAIVTAGALAMLGGIGAVAATVIPIQSYDTGSGSPDLYTLLPLPFLGNGDLNPSTWYAAEPLAFGSLAIVVGWLLLTTRLRLGFVAGLLTGLGLIGLLNYGSTLLSSLADGSGPYSSDPAIGVFVGLGGSLLIVASGGLAARAERRAGS